jgi:multiple sugar transport system permease protein
MKHRPVPHQTYDLRAQNIRFALLIIAPAFVIAGAALYYPIFNSVLMSTQRVYFGSNRFDWVGLTNFRAALRGSVFLKSFVWTLLYGVLSVVLLFTVGMYFALLLNRGMPGSNVIRGLLLMPWSIPVFVNAFLWLWLLNVQYGFVNYILVTLRILREPIHWTGGTVVAKASVLVAYVWRVFPFNMIVYLAAFQTVDPMYYEVAEMEGAGKVQRFFLTIAMLRNIITFTALLNFIWAFQEFTTIWIMTRGGPAGATNTLMTQVYTRSFMERNFGEAAAMGTLWVVFLVVFSVFYIRFLLTREEYR